MNTRAKGNRAEVELCSCLESVGYTAWRRRGTARYGNVDILELFDIIAVPRKELDDDWLLFIQLKTNKSHFYDARKKIKKFAEEHFFGYDNALVTALRLKPKVYRFDIRLYRLANSVEKLVDFNVHDRIITADDLC